jgi:hypothetical protein
LHIDVEYQEYSDPADLSSERLSREGYTNLCTEFFTEDLQTPEITNPTLKRSAFDDNNVSDMSKCDFIDADFCALNESENSGEMLSHSNKEIDESFTDNKCFTEVSRNDEEDTPIPPVRFDFERSNLFDSANEISSATRSDEETTMENLGKYESDGNLDAVDTTPESYADCIKDGDKGDNDIVYIDTKSLIVQQKIAYFENQGLEDKD